MLQFPIGTPFTHETVVLLLWFFMKYPILEWKLNMYIFFCRSVCRVVWHAYKPSFPNNCVVYIISGGFRGSVPLIGIVIMIVYSYTPPKRRGLWTNYTLDRCVLCEPAILPNRGVVCEPAIIPNRGEFVNQLYYPIEACYLNQLSSPIEAWYVNQLYIKSVTCNYHQCHVRLNINMCFPFLYPEMKLLGIQE